MDSNILSVNPVLIIPEKVVGYGGPTGLGLGYGGPTGLRLGLGLGTVGYGGPAGVRGGSEDMWEDVGRRIEKIA
jgi:hypothetical protein